MVGEGQRLQELSRSQEDGLHPALQMGSFSCMVGIPTPISALTTFSSFACDPSLLEQISILVGISGIRCHDLLRNFAEVS